MNDFRFAFRQLLKNPGFTAVAVLTLALGIGANTTVFSWVRAVLLDTVPGARQTDRLVVLCPRHVSGRLTDTTSVLDNRDLAAERSVFAGITGSRYDAVSLRLGQETEWVWAESASANFFEVLGVTPAYGRFFRPDEDTHPGGDSVVVISHALWQKRFGGDPGVLGRVVEIANQPLTIIGVAPVPFRGGMGGLRFDVWVPITMTTEFKDTGEAMRRRDWRFLHTYGRLQPGVSLSQAQAAASTVMQRLAREQADTNRDLDMAVLPVWKAPWGGQAAFLPLLRSLAAAAVLLLLLVIGNMANLLLARATGREQEMAVRLALGAKRMRLVRQLLIESVWLAGLGGGLGCLFAVWGVEVLFKLLPPLPHLPVGYEMRLSGSVLLFTAGLTVLTGVLFGLVPAWQAAQTNLNEPLKQAGRTGGPGAGHHRLRTALVIGEVTLAVVLLTGMTLCARSLQQARKIDLGLDPAQVWAAGFRLPVIGYDDERTRHTYRRLREALEALPGVESVAFADWLPLGVEGGSSTRFAAAGYQPAPGEPMSAGISTVSPRYFATLRIPILAGREFDERDDFAAARVVVINQWLANRYFPGRDPLGLNVEFWGRSWRVVGVAKNGPYRALNEPGQPFLYVCEPQVGDRSLAAVVRSAGEPRALAQAVEQTAMAIDPLLKPMAALALTEYTAGAFIVPRMAAILVAALGGMALVLSALGIYAVIAYSVSQRTREIGLRMALGAQRYDVLGLFLGQGLKLAGLGLVAGIIGSLAAAPVLSSLLVGVAPTDPWTYASVVLLLMVVALLACWLPARRATRVDPMQALRCD